MIEKKSKIKVGILGGSFDPITVGHVDLANFVLNNNIVDQVWIIPCKKHKYDKKMESPTHRLNMCRIATSSFNKISVNGIEVKSCLSGTTYDLIKAIKSNDITNSIYEFSFIIGQDNANTFSNWYKNEELIKEISFIVVPRKGVETLEDWYKNPPHIFLDMETNIPEISSTEIRKALSFPNKKSDFLKNNLNSKVLDYIIKHKLYS